MAYVEFTLVLRRALQADNLRNKPVHALPLRRYLLCSTQSPLAVFLGIRYGPCTQSSLAFSLPCLDCCRRVLVDGGLWGPWASRWCAVKRQVCPRRIFYSSPHLQLNIRADKHRHRHHLQKYYICLRSRAMTHSRGHRKPITGLFTCESAPKSILLRYVRSILEKISAGHWLPVHRDVAGDFKVFGARSDLR